jgi:hypothetical protein
VARSFDDLELRDALGQGPDDLAAAAVGVTG